MSSIWTSNVTGADGNNPFATTGMAAAGGGAAATKYRSMIQQSPGSQNQDRTSSKALLSGGTSRTIASGISPADSSSASTSSGSTATITANDFLTLLVTEMQNQDPTSQTDPNEYINQLVQINSLEQLISINQNLSTVLGSPTSPTTTTPSAISSVATTAASASSFPNHNSGAVPLSNHRGAASSVSIPSAPRIANQTPRQSAAQSTVPSRFSGTSKVHSAVPGNLAPPAESAAGRAVGRSLDGHSQSGNQHHNHGIRDIPTRALANQ